MIYTSSGPENFFDALPLRSRNWSSWALTQNRLSFSRPFRCVDTVTSCRKGEELCQCEGQQNYRGTDYKRGA